MTDSLFRQEVYEGRKSQALGRAVPLYAERTLPLVAMLVATVLAIGIWLVTGTFARSELVDGWVVPNGPMARISPTRGGTLVSLDVQDGQRVRKGQRLGVVEIQGANALSSDPGGASLAIVSRQQAELGQQQRLAQAGAGEDIRRLRDVAAQTQARIASTERQIALQADRVASAQNSFSILSKAADDRHISKIDFENQKRSYLAEKAQLEQLHAQEAELRTQLAETQAQLRRTPIELGQKVADLANSRLLLDQQQLEVEGGRTFVLTAPIDGQVAAIQSRSGQAVGPERPVMYVLGSDATMEVEVYAPSKAVGFARAGQEVRLMYDAFPFQQFGSFKGTIRDISRTALAPTDINAPIKLEQAAYRMRIALDRQAIQAFGRSYPIQPGMTLKANVILDRQSFLDWLLEPIRAVRNRT